MEMVVRTVTRVWGIFGLIRVLMSVGVRFMGMLMALLVGVIIMSHNLSTAKGSEHKTEGY